MFSFMNVVHSLVNYAIFRELCDWMRFEVDCAKSHHRIVSEGLTFASFQNWLSICNSLLILITYVPLVLFCFCILATPNTM